jgi:hypothetical protein
LPLTLELAITALELGVCGFGLGLFAVVKLRGRTAGNGAGRAGE